MNDQKRTLVALMFLLGLLIAGNGCANAPATPPPPSPSETNAEPSAPGNISPESKLIASDARPYLFFGQSVALSGDTLVVGAAGYAGKQEYSGGPHPGAVYVFQRDGAAWVERARLTGSATGVGDGFGCAVAVDGDTLVAGARLENDAVGGNSAGAAYVFRRRGAAWVEQARLTASDGAPFDLFGHAVAISGDTVVVGARSADDPAGGRNAGAAYVFQRRGEAWIEQTRLTASDAMAADHLGHAVAIHGDTVAVGAFGRDDPQEGRNSGAVYIFQRRGETWTEQARLVADDARPLAQFGYALAMSQDILVVSANQDDDALASGAASFFPENSFGAVYVFQQREGTWRQQAKLTAGQSEGYGPFGEAVAVGHTARGDVVLAVGAMGTETIHRFQRTGNDWVEIPGLTATSDSFTLVGLGTAVAASGEFVAVGASMYSAPPANVSAGDQGATFAGAVYVYDQSAAPAQPLATQIPEPTAVPLPPPTLSVEKTSVEPLLTLHGSPYEGILFIGWSPDGQIAALSTTQSVEDDSSDRLFVTLQLLQVRSGELCQFPDTYKGMTDVRSRVAWLPDGRLLVVTDHNDVVLHTPCADRGASLGDAFPESILDVAASDPDGATLLLRGQQAYWLFDPATQAVRRVEGLTPATTQQYDANDYDWSPAGNQVAISALGNDSQATGDAVHLVNVQTAEVEQTIELDSASEGQAPGLEWLTSDRLMIWQHREPGPVQLTLRPGDPQITPIVPALLGLDIVHSEGIAAMGGFGDPAADTCHFVLMPSAPGSDRIYLYHSETGAVETLPYEQPTFLFFPNDDWMWVRAFEWANPPRVPESVDEFQLIWVDSTREARRLVVAGHIPRQYADLSAAWLADRSQMAFSSSQGISLVSIPDGTLLDFWRLEGYDIIAFPALHVSPAGDVMLATAQFGAPEGQPTGAGLYLIRLTH